MVTIIAFLIQSTSGGGAGSWVTGFSALVCLLVAGLALLIGEKNITKSDWIAFIAALTTIPLWLITKLPLCSMILIVAIEFLGTYPTFRKSWSRPQDEPALSYSITGTKFIFSLLALENVTSVTALYPASMIVMNAMLVALLLTRRKTIKVFI